MYLHPYLFPPLSYKELSRGRKTVNIANFIAACRQLHVPEEEVKCVCVCVYVLGAVLNCTWYMYMYVWQGV